mgnify:CR=1 FL=1
MEKLGYLKPDVKRVLMLDPIMDDDTITMSVDPDPYDGEFGANAYDGWDAEEQNDDVHYSVWDSEK